MSEDIIRVLRVIEYIGPRSWVESTVANSIQGTKLLMGGKEIRAATVGTYPEILQNLPDAGEFINEPFPEQK